jgi:hypothetical protein
LFNLLAFDPQNREPQPGRVSRHIGAIMIRQIVLVSANLSRLQPPHRKRPTKA